MATIDLGKIKQVWRGTYNNGTAYTVDDLVEYTDTGITSTYICVANSTGNAPSSGGSAHASWNYVAKGTASSALSNSGSDQTVWYASSTTNVSLSAQSFTEVLSLTLPQLSANTLFMVIFTEDRREQNWNTTIGQYQYSTDGGSGYTQLGLTDGMYDKSAISGNATAVRGDNIYNTHSGTYMLPFLVNQTPKFRINGQRFGGSNQYFLNHEGASSIIAIKIN